MRQRGMFFGGIRAALPVCLGVIPVGISYGLIAVQSGLTLPEAVGMSVFVMAGSSQLMAVGMFAQGAALFSIFMAVFFLNLRHIVMSTSAMSRLEKTSLLEKLVCAFALCDESFALFSLSGGNSAEFLFGANTAIYIAWVGSSLAGCVADRFLPALIVHSFGIAFYAAFLAMLTPHMRKSRQTTGLVILTAVVNMVLQRFLPGSVAVILSMVVCALLGAIAGKEGEENDAL